MVTASGRFAAVYDCAPFGGEGSGTEYATLGQKGKEWTRLHRKSPESEYFRVIFRDKREVTYSTLWKNKLDH